MDQPKFVLYFCKEPILSNSPYTIKEYAVIQHGQVASKYHSSYRHLTDALEAMSHLSKEPVILAFTQETIFDE
jgi:hypothetical protein